MDIVNLLLHQWSQPLNLISLYSELVEENLQNGTDRKEILRDVQKIRLQAHHMIDTLNEFRTLLSGDKEKSFFSVRKNISSVLLLLEDLTNSNRVKIEILGGDFQIFGYPNEFKHVIFNLLTNSISIFRERDIRDRKIEIEILDREIRIRDNGGGADEVDKIFEKGWTTRKENGGSGLGLYLVREILDRIEAKISAKNIRDGIEFSISMI